MELMRQLLDEAASHPEIILLSRQWKPGIASARRRMAQFGEETLAKGQNPVHLPGKAVGVYGTPSQRRGLETTNSTIWLEKAAQGSVPREL